MTEGEPDRTGQDRPGGGECTAKEHTDRRTTTDNRKIESRYRIGDRKESLGNGDAQNRSVLGNSPSTESFQIEDSSAPLDDKHRSRPVREVEHSGMRDCRTREPNYD